MKRQTAACTVSVVKATLHFLLPEKPYISAMASAAYYVALPFARNDDGDLVAGEPQGRHSRATAASAARDLAKKHGGAIAFSRTGDPDADEFKNAEKIGDVPADLGELL